VYDLRVSYCKAIDGCVQKEGTQSLRGFRTQGIGGLECEGSRKTASPVDETVCTQVRVVTGLMPLEAWDHSATSETAVNHGL